MKIAWSIYAGVQVVIIILCFRSDFDLNAALGAAVILAIISGGYLAWLCMSTGRRPYAHRLRRYLTATVVGLIILAPLAWVFIRDIDAPFVWMKEHPHPGSLLVAAYMQVLPFTAVMAMFTIVMVGSKVPWFSGKPKPR